MNCFINSANVILPVPFVHDISDIQNISLVHYCRLHVRCAAVVQVVSRRPVTENDWV